MNKNGNPNWVKGVSPNPEGRRAMKHSALTIKGKVERFLNKNISPNKLQKMFNALSEKERLQMILELLPYAASKQPAMSFDRLSDNDLDTLYSRVMEGLNKPVIPLIPHD